METGTRYPLAPSNTTTNQPSTELQLLQAASAGRQVRDSAEDRPEFDSEPPVYPQLSTELNRLVAFQDLVSSPFTRYKLAYAGFYYSGNADCRIVFCGVGLRSWDENYDPLVDDVCWRPQRGYRRATKGSAACGSHSTSGKQGYIDPLGGFLNAPRDTGGSGCFGDSSGSSGGAPPGNHRETNRESGGFEETPNGHSGSSGNSGFPGSPGLLRDTPGGTGRPDDFLLHTYATAKCVGGRQYGEVTFEVGHQGSFASPAMVSGDGSRWEEVTLLKDDEGRPPVMEVRIMPFGREGYYWKVDLGTSIVQAIDLKSLDQGSTVSVSWKLCNTEPGRMAGLQCVVEMCQHRMNQYGAIDKTERTKFPLTLQARDFSSPNAPVGNNDDSPVYRGGIPSVGEHEHIVTHLLDIVAQHKTLQDETALRLSRLELRDTKREDEISQIRQQQEMDNRRIADLEKFKEKFSQVQPSSDD